MSTLDLDAKKKYIEGLLAIVTLIFVFVSDIENNLFYYFIFVFMAAAIIAITFLNFNRENPETCILRNLVIGICSLVLAISFSLVFSSIFYLKTIDDHEELLLFKVVSMVISVYMFLALTHGLGSDIRYSFTRLNPYIGSGFETVKFVGRLVWNACSSVFRQLWPETHINWTKIFLTIIILLIICFFSFIILPLMLEDYTPSPSIKQI